VGGSVGAELREGKGDHLEFKERSRRISGKALIQVRGVVLLVYIYMYMSFVFFWTKWNVQIDDSLFFSAFS